MHRKWTDQEQLIALKLYCELEFGQFNRTNKLIIEIAQKIQRTPSALTMKLCNFAALDPAHQGKGLKNFSVLDKKTITMYLENPATTIIRAEENWDKIITNQLCNNSYSNNKEIEHEIQDNFITEKKSTTKTRTIQSSFRKTVLSSYKHKCSICEIDITELLVASHIVPWSDNEKLRGDPRNGISLCNIHDKAFDKGLIGFTNDLRLLLGKEIIQKKSNEMIYNIFHKYNHSVLNPTRFTPLPEYLQYHREHILK